MRTALALLLSAHLVYACGGSTFDRARHVLEASAVAVNSADLVLAGVIRRECAAFRGNADAVDQCVRSRNYDDAVAAIVSADHALRATQAGIDAAERADRGEWIDGALPCAVHASVSAVNLVTTITGEQPSALLLEVLAVVVPIASLCVEMPE